MSRRASPIELTPEEQSILDTWARGRKIEARLVQRAQIWLAQPLAVTNDVPVLNLDHITRLTHQPLYEVNVLLIRIQRFDRGLEHKDVPPLGFGISVTALFAMIKSLIASFG